jgi:hypothetical protein
MSRALGRGWQARRWTVLWGALLPWVASAGPVSVYLNGVNIDGVTNQHFDKASVRIDEKGNVLIDAPNYSAKSVAEPPPPKPSAQTQVAAIAPRLTKKVFLVAEQNPPGMTQFDIDVYVNSKWVKKLRNGEEQQIVELTPFLAPGKNSVLFSAKKNIAGQRKSLTSAHVFKVMVGEGDVGGNNVMLDGTLAKWERTGADSADESREFTFNAR